MSSTIAEPLRFEEIARIPAPGDNVAIASRTLPAGARILLRQLIFELSFTVLEGHRFAVFRIRKGELLLSWGLPFGLATRDIEPGEYVCNEKILRALAERHVSFALPPAANFLDYRHPFRLDRHNFRPGAQVSAPAPHPTFLGYRRHPSRGVGTRNFIVIIGTHSRTGSFARNVAAQFQDIPKKFNHIDGVVAVAHTEGGTKSRPNNFELTLKTLAGFVTNPNVGAVLCVDQGGELLSNKALHDWLRQNKYPIEGLLLDFISIGASVERAEAAAMQHLQEWLPQVNAYQREPSPISLLRLGLQCGGSDAFSGVSANPLVGILSREIVAHGGSANLAETDELIGAESYVLSNVRNLETAEAFLERLDRFQQWAREHGHSAEGNPSGGNNFRGLYNIAIKSIGAARKKDPATRLDYVIQFAERMTAPGFYFMDSPGNDLESIAGQVAAGCNMILFATGNGSITNFPFVPTIKIMTTSRRFELVRNEMDFNAGRYQDGEPLEDLGREAFSQMLDIASGRQSAGEKAGHSQVQLWREWRGHGESRPGSKETADPRPSTEFQSEHLEIAREITRAERLLRVALVLPTSLCSGQIALAIAERLNQIPQGKRDFSHAVALPHTEGCGNSGGESERLFLRTMAGYLMHPFVSKALLLEHGCEKTHNDAFRNVLRDLQIPESRYGFGSIQLDGGIDRVAAKSIEWFLRHESAPNHGQPFTLALHGRDMPPALSAEFEKVKNALLAAGAAVVTSSEIGGGRPILYGEHIASPALYAMECPTDDDLEIVTGLAATGAEIIVVYQPDFRLPSNPLVPTIQLGPGPDADVTVAEDSRDLAASILSMVLAVRQGRTKTSAETIQNVAFQMTRGLEGISL